MRRRVQAHGSQRVGSTHLEDRSGPVGAKRAETSMQAAPGRAESPETASERPVYRVECPQLRLCRIAQMSESPNVRNRPTCQKLPTPHLHPVESLLAPPRSACVHSWGGDGGRRRAGLFRRVFASTTTSIVFFHVHNRPNTCHPRPRKVLERPWAGRALGGGLCSPFWRRINWCR